MNCLEELFINDVDYHEKVKLILPKSLKRLIITKMDGIGEIEGIQETQMSQSMKDHFLEQF